MHWSGTMTHVTESCDDGLPHLILHVDTTPGDVHETKRLEEIHDALRRKSMVPSEHLVNAGYVSARHLVDAKHHHGIELVGPPRRDPSWQRRVGDGFRIADFAVDWRAKRARCPQGHDGVSWYERCDAPR